VGITSRDALLGVREESWYVISSTPI
jgi:hypothetical protein